jgi:hypothetical protein
VLADSEDSLYRATLSSFALEQDAFYHLYPEIGESPELRYEYEIEEATFSPSPFSDLVTLPA